VKRKMKLKRKELQERVTQREEGQQSSVREGG